MAEITAIIPTTSSHRNGVGGAGAVLDVVVEVEVVGGIYPKTSGSDPH
jgi:hypothetical protein